jgi:hypothetical protein
MNKIKNRFGFSLVELMMITGAIAGIALVIMQLSKNSANTQSDAFSMADYISLRAEVDNSFSNDFDCTASLKDITFRGSEIKTKPIEIDLWHGDQNQKRNRKFLSASDPSVNKYGKLVISTLNLSMPDFTAKGDFPQGNGVTFKAEINIEGEKSKSGKLKEFIPIKKTVNITFDTDASGDSKIVSCSVSSARIGFTECGLIIKSCDAGFAGENCPLGFAEMKGSFFAAKGAVSMSGAACDANVAGKMAMCCR